MTEPINHMPGKQPSNEYAVDFGDESMQSALMQSWGKIAAPITEESFTAFWNAELDRYKRNPLNLTTEQLAEIERISKELAE